jgi:hypothetical protein
LAISRSRITSNPTELLDIAKGPRVAKRTRSMKQPLFLSVLLLLAACGTGDPNADEQADDLIAGNPQSLNIGFNGGPDQFPYLDQFFAANTGKATPRLCHTYVAWDLASQPANGDPSVAGTRAWLASWLAQAAGHCDEALISFKSQRAGSPPSVATLRSAFEAFLAIPWAADTGFTGSFAFTPWNEPNNGDVAGNGLGAPIPPELAARYFLMMTQVCDAHGCKVAAGDFASNGNMWNDFEWNCANDNVTPRTLCKVASSQNPTRRPASYLDRYKNTIASYAQDYGLGEGFRPRWFAFHGWHDVNMYLSDGDHCGSYDDCATRRLLVSLGGSWGGVELWDSEVGMGQKAALSDDDQACGAAFLMRLSTVSRRITRIYDTRLHGGTLELFDGQTPRPAFTVLAHRETRYSGASCQ